MFEVILQSEIGNFSITSPMTLEQANAWVSKNKARYGSGQRLIIEFVGN